jgi:hypothetical protein
MMLLLRICFPGITPALMFILVTELGSFNSAKASLRAKKFRPVRVG